MFILYIPVVRKIVMSPSLKCRTELWCRVARDECTITIKLARARTKFQNFSANICDVVVFTAPQTILEIRVCDRWGKFEFVSLALCLWAAQNGARWDGWWFYGCARKFVLYYLLYAIDLVKSFFPFDSLFPVICKRCHPQNCVQSSWKNSS